MIPNADMEVPYEGAKEMILVDDVENREFLRASECSAVDLLRGNGSHRDWT